MLVLSRKENESVTLQGSEYGADVVTVTVLAIQGNRVKLGFAAPEAVKIVRSELLETPPETEESSA